MALRFTSNLNTISKCVRAINQVNTEMSKYGMYHIKYGLYSYNNSTSDIQKIYALYNQTIFLNDRLKEVCCENTPKIPEISQNSSKK